MSIDPAALAALVTAPYENRILLEADDHVVRMSVMTEPFHWHRHPNGDEVFIGVEGTVLIETEHERMELGPGQLYAVPAGVAHATAPLTPRTVNLTFERAALSTERVAPA